MEKLLGWIADHPGAWLALGSLFGCLAWYWIVALSLRLV